MATTRWISLVAVLSVALAASATAQIPSLKKIKDAAKKVVKPADSTVAKPADSAAAKPVGPAAAGDAARPTAKPDVKVWDNYDFVPGNKVIFFTDFSEDKVGNFARGLKSKSGPAEVIERDAVKVLR